MHVTRNEVFWFFLKSEYIYLHKYIFIQISRTASKPTHAEPSPSPNPFTPEPLLSFNFLISSQNTYAAIKWGQQD